MKEKQKLINGNHINAIILARSGSKSIKDKNLKLIQGKPLIYYCIDAALKSKLISKVYFLTDSRKYARIASSYGAIVPFLRPKNISHGNSKDIETFKYFVDWINKKKLSLPKIIVHLRATSPLVLSKDIDMAIEKFIKNKKCDSLKTVNITKHNPYKMWKIDPKGYLKPILRLNESKEPWNEPRQKLPKIVFQNAQIDIFKTALIYKNTVSGKKIIPYFLENYIDIDDKYDLAEADIKLQLRKKKKNLKLNISNLK